MASTRPRARAAVAGEQTAAGDVLSAGFAADVARLEENLPIIREDRDHEGVHQARVATRRMRSTLRTFGGLIDKETSRRLAADLAVLGGLLGEVRDLDVLGERFAGSAGDLETDQLEAVLGRLSADRQSAYVALMVALDSRETEKLLERVRRFAADPPLREKRAARPAGEVLVPEVRRRVRELRSAVESLPVAPHDELLHHLRILAKRVRYAAEVTAGAGPPGTVRLGKRAKRLQEALGAVSDGARAVAWLDEAKRRWPAEPGHGPDPLVAVELLLATEHRSLARGRATWRASYEPVLEAARALGWTPPDAATADGAGREPIDLEAVRATR